MRRTSGVALSSPETFMAMCQHQEVSKKKSVYCMVPQHGTKEVFRPSLKAVVTVGEEDLTRKLTLVSVS